MVLFDEGDENGMAFAELVFAFFNVMRSEVSIGIDGDFRTFTFVQDERHGVEVDIGDCLVEWRFVEIELSRTVGKGDLFALGKEADPRTAFLLGVADVLDHVIDSFLSDSKVFDLTELLIRPDSESLLGEYETVDFIPFFTKENAVSFNLIFHFLSRNGRNNKRTVSEIY
jgi:hypothetical protein